MKKSAEFIRHKGRVYFPRPNQWAGGLARHKWYERLTGEEPLIASQELWEQLKEEHPIQIIIETMDGKWEIEDKEWEE
jgi:hypothetical protein